MTQTHNQSHPYGKGVYSLFCSASDMPYKEMGVFRGGEWFSHLRVTRLIRRWACLGAESGSRTYA